MEVDSLLPALTVAAALIAALFAALRFNRDDTTAVVTQQKALTDSMRDLNAELEGALNRCRMTTEATVEHARALQAEVDRLRTIIHTLESD
jgi:hypothetical protein